MKKLLTLMMIVTMLVGVMAGCDELTPEEIKMVERLADENEDVAKLLEGYKSRESVEDENMPESSQQGPGFGHPRRGQQGPGMGQTGSDQQGGPLNAAKDMTVEGATIIEEGLLQNQVDSNLIGTYVINDTGTNLSYDNWNSISLPGIGDDFYGQDSNYITNAMDFTDNGDGTVTDNNTGLIWLQPADEKMTWEEAVVYGQEYEASADEGWRLPTIKELYSLIDFSGNTTDTPYIDTDYFEFHWGDETGERSIDSQYATSTIYESTTMNNMVTMFGVNFADGRIKGYPITKTFYVMLVKDSEAYGLNNFVDNGDGTVTDLATGLTWMTFDSGAYLGDDGFMDWEAALEWAENMEFAGYDDWKLPDAKELQSILDYERSPDTTDSAAIDPKFDTTEFINIMGDTDYGYYWTSTTHAENGRGGNAVYIAFGRALGQMQETTMDVHGAGAQRSDPKSGDEEDYPSLGNGPQGDERRVFNLVRLVREN